MNILNVEMKAKCNELDAIRKILKNADAEFRGTDFQTDTYFNNPEGRLKLRSGNIENSLIFYNRENVADLKVSNIVMEKFPPTVKIRDVLAASLGILVEVKKQREIYFVKNIKFHLDTVSELGTFIEIEAIAENDQFSSKELFDQATFYLDKFKPYIISMIEVSYSDLIMEQAKPFRAFLENAATDFLNFLDSELTSKKLNLSLNNLDHLCFRVTTDEEYNHYKNKLAQIADLLTETMIDGRPIASWKLHNPIQFQQRKISVVELPSPKPDNKYPLGFEHAEFVINDSFEAFAKNYPQLNFDLAGTFKKNNPELRLSLSNNKSIKFHHQTLEQVIQDELKDSLK